MIIENLEYKESAIYSITNTDNGMVYIGQAVNYHKRAISHRSALNKNTHYNQHLQRVYNKYSDILKMTIVEFVNKESLTERENYWIELFDARNDKKGYNMIEGGRLIKPISYTQERKDKLSKSLKDTFQSDEYIEYRKVCSKRMSENPLMLGKKHSDSWRKAIAETNERKRKLGIKKKGIKVRVLNDVTYEIIGEFDRIKDVTCIAPGYITEKICKLRKEGITNWTTLEFKTKKLIVERV